jgi:RNA polymerase subunit RPABC4/transcription elongation factor Spt4
MEDYKTRTFRIGGKGGEWAFIVGDIAEIEEEPLPIHVYICPLCGKMELFAYEQTMKILLSRQGLKKCVKCGKNIPLASEVCPYCGTKQKKSI